MIPPNVYLDHTVFHSETFAKRPLDLGQISADFEIEHFSKVLQHQVDTTGIPCILFSLALQYFFAKDLHRE